MTDNALLGTWVTDPTDEVTRERFGHLVMCFEADGSLTYTIRTEERDRIMLLRYRVERDVVITDQPSAPREERTQFGFTSEGRLVLNYRGFTAYFVRQAATGVE
jgi:hypothetical protein